MTEAELRNKICAQARSWLGLHESGSYQPILDCYNAYARTHGLYVMTKADPWCAMFVSAVAIKCGVESILPPEVSCGRMIALFQRLGEWEENDAYCPKPGDVIFYDWQDSGSGDNKGESDHVGIVVGVSGRTISVIEGNCSDAVRMTTRQVNGRYIRGYGLPDYAKLATDKDCPSEDVEQPEAPEKPAESVLTCSVNLPILYKKDGVDEAVRAAQALLAVRGYKCGWYGADGEFGPATEDAVKRFQTAYGLDADGIIGKETWNKLINF